MHGLLLPRAPLVRRGVLNDLGSWASVQFAKVPVNQKVLVTDHQTYSHLASRYDLKEISMLDSYTTGGALKPSSLNAITKAVSRLLVQR